MTTKPPHRAGANVAGRVAKARPPALYAAVDAVILAIDPGETSGFAAFAHGVPKASGMARASPGRAHAIWAAQTMAADYDLPLVVVAETWPRRMRGGVTTGALVSWSLWKESLAEAGVPKSRIVRVHMGKWSAKILGHAFLTTEARRARSIAIAKARFGLDATHDEAAAICIGLYASHAGEVAKALPKRRAQKGRAA